ncbi:MAG: hypothetical protein C5T88_01590 [Williamsoniiplasma luminosum]|uniref:Uncharacterized protein n=2 Tax=Williamsoniiplasma luminosum TaxID=214888 RepID=A0A2S0NJU1_9MOLU|nr:MAG: hypothetical protein C5T88_01590 [Williamsoniiplasma luminosum]
MQLTIFKYFYRSTLKSKFLWISSAIFTLVFIILLGVFAFNTIGDTSTIDFKPSLLKTLLYIFGVVQITAINLFIFSKYFSNSTKDGTISLEIRSGISKQRMFFERILLSKSWTIGIYIFCTLLILLFAGISPSSILSSILFNFSIGFIAVFLYDLALTGVLLIIAIFGSNLLMGIFGILILFLGAITPVVVTLEDFTNKREISQYASDGQIYRDYESYIIADEVHNLVKEYGDKSWTKTMLDSYHDLFNSISIQNQNSTVSTPLEEEKIYNIAFSGLLTEFDDGIERHGDKHVYTDTTLLNRSELFSHLKDVKKLQKLDKDPYNKSNDYGRKIWEQSFYFNKNSSSSRDKFKFNYDGKNGFNALMESLNKDGSPEKKKFYNLINRVVKNSLIIFDSNRLDNDRNWGKWNLVIGSKEDNEWLENVNISLGARMYQTAFIKVINSAINLPTPQMDLSDYYHSAKVSLYANPWSMFNRIINNNYFGSEILGNRIEQTSFNRSWVNKEIVVELKPEKREHEIFNSTSNLGELEVKDQIFNPVIAIFVYAAVFIIIIIGSFFIFRYRMKK